MSRQSDYIRNVIYITFKGRDAIGDQTGKITDVAQISKGYAGELKPIWNVARIK